MTHLLLVLVLAAAAGATCPDTCKCTRHPLLVDRVSVRCRTFANLTQIDEMYDLALDDLDREQLEQVFGTLEEINSPYLDRLTIERSVVPELSNFTLQLKYVKLSGNRIARLPELNVTNLKILDLSNNSLVSVEEAFRTLQNLETLNLSANFLTVIESNSFSGLESLKCLDLSGNKLTALNDSIFLPLQSLQYLNLSSNNLQSLNEQCFITLTKLQQLDVSFNHLIRVELGSLQLPSLARLLLTGNSELGASRKTVLFGQRLQSVDASRIGLEQVPAALTHSIRTLRLMGNAIKSVRCGDLDSYPLLQLLDFNSNGLELIEDDALGRLDSLSILYLTNNNMTEVPKSLSEKLKVLHLEHNAIQQVRSKDLQGLTALEVLLLNDNKIRLIEADAFNQLTSLVTLDISRNPIKVLEAGCLSGSMALQVLRLADIAVTSPPKELSFPLLSTEHLITLDLSGSPGLARQLMADTAALAASRQMQELDLSNTQLEYVRSDLLHFLPQLRIFHIQGNRINCTQLEWLAAWMRRQDEPEYREVMCASPPELWGTLLIDVQEIEVFAQATTEILTSSTAEESFEIKAFFQNNVTNANEAGSANKSEGMFDSNSSHERGEMSMFSARQSEGKGAILLVLVSSMLGTVALLAMLAVRFARRRRIARILQDEVEVSSLPGVTELW